MSSTEQPLVSIIVPTRNRAAFLEHLMVALSKQTYSSERTELVVIDDASTDDTQGVLKRWQPKLPFKLTILRQETRGGQAVVRNIAVARARGTILAFTDSDCMPEPDWVRNGVAAIEGGAAVVCGPIDPQRLDGTHWLFNAQLNPVTSDNGLYPTANLFVRRAEFDEVGGFAEDIAAWGGIILGDDSDLAWRIRKLGKPVLFAPDVKIVHLATPISRRAWLKRPVMLSIMPQLVRRIPEIREASLWHGYFLSKQHFYFDLAVGSLLLAAALLLARVSWGWVALAGMLPWFYVVIRAHMLHALRTRPQIALPLFILIAQQFAATFLVLVAASIRYRRLVL